MAQNTHMLSVITGDGNVHSGNITDSFKNSFYRSDEDAQIMRWLSPLEPNNTHQAVRTDRFEGIGDWFLETKEFREWRGSEGEADKAVLFCTGNPGVGKTYLSSLVIDTLSDQAGEGDIAVAALYCDFISHQEQTITSIMGAILKQLLSRGSIPNYVREAFQEAKAEFGGRSLRLADLIRMLKIAIASLPQVFICIDALDECLPKFLPELLGSLRDIVRECPCTRIFLTGRPHVTEDVRRFFTQTVVIPISPNMDDIRNYLEMRFEGDPEPEAMSSDLRADIVGTILEKISDIFLLVSLNMDAILDEVTIHQRRRKLEEMTQGRGLGDAYTATLTRLKAQKGYKSALGLKVLMWVLYSERPLRAEELCHALGVEIGSVELDPENVPVLRTLLAACLGLVTIEASSSTVRLVHFTLQEYLSSDPTLFHSPHSAIAEVCLTYLNFGCVRDLSPTLDSAPSTMPLLEYSSYYWGDHARKGITENVKILALRLLDRFDEHISAKLMLLRHNEDRSSGLDFDRVGRSTGLHAVAFFGIVEIVATVLDMKEWDVNATDSMGSTALTWAARGGHEEIVKALLERADVSPDLADSSGQTPLMWAARIGCAGAVKALLERKDVNPDPVDSAGRTPLMWAASIGCEGAVKALLEQDVNPDPVDSSGRTPLSWMAGEGCEGAVKALLERNDVNHDLADFNGRTPLLWATLKKDERVVKLFLERRYLVPEEAAIGQVSPVSPTERSEPPQPPSKWIPVTWFSSQNQATPTHDTRPAIRIAIDMCFLIAALFFLSHLLTTA